MDKISLGNKLRDMRIASELKWDEILRKMQDEHDIKIARSTIYGYEHGRNYPDPNILFALCQIYDCIEDLQELGFNQKPTLQSDGVEEIVLFENEFTADEWLQLKGFVNYVIANHKQ